jgi:transcriptional regulator with XRE-family HTH domain
MLTPVVAPPPSPPADVSTLRALREARGLSQVALAQLAGVHELTILRIEKRRNARGIKFDTLRKLADVLGVHPHQLLGRTAIPKDDPPPEPVELPVPPMADDVLFIADLAEVLRCSDSTIRRTLMRRPWDLPRPLASVDKRYRWSRQIVERWLQGDPTAAGPRERTRGRR